MPGRWLGRVRALLVGPSARRVVPTTPPSLAVWLLGCLGPRRSREGMLGDLHEEYVHFVLEERGPTWAKLWYWSQVLAVLLRYRTPFVLLARLCRHAGKALPPKHRFALGALAREAWGGMRALWSARAFSRTVIAGLAAAAGTVAAILGGGSSGPPNRGLVNPPVAPEVAEVFDTSASPATLENRMRTSAAAVPADTVAGPTRSIRGNAKLMSARSSVIATSDPSTERAEARGATGDHGFGSFPSSPTLSATRPMVTTGFPIGTSGDSGARADTGASSPDSSAQPGDSATSSARRKPLRMEGDTLHVKIWPT
jgi:hypothetical protein